LCRTKFLIFEPDKVPVLLVLQLKSILTFLFSSTFSIICHLSIAVPAAMPLVNPKSNPSLYLPMALGITFPFNITLGMPLYMALIMATG